MSIRAPSLAFPRPTRVLVSTLVVLLAGAFVVTPRAQAVTNRVLASLSITNAHLEGQSADQVTEAAFCLGYGINQAFTIPVDVTSGSDPLLTEIGCASGFAPPGPAHDFWPDQFPLLNDNYLGVKRRLTNGTDNRIWTCTLAIAQTATSFSFEAVKFCGGGLESKRLVGTRKPG